MSLLSIKTTLGVVMMHLCLTSSGYSAEFHRYIDHLADGTPAEQVEASCSALWRAREKAFPALISRLDDCKRADARFQRAEADHKTGRIVDPTIGRTCLGILQGQIEGVWPKSYRQFGVLNARTAKKWIEKHRGNSLAEMRGIATAESLRRAEQALKRSPNDKALRAAVEFFRDDYEERQRKQLRMRATDDPFEF